MLAFIQNDANHFSIVFAHVPVHMNSIEAKFDFIANKSMDEYEYLFVVQVLSSFPREEYVNRMISNGNSFDFTKIFFQCFGAKTKM